MYEEIEELLLQEAEPDFCKFTSRLLPGVEPILGVRLPKLHRLAKTLAKGEYKKFLMEAPETSYEMILLKGMVIGYAKGLPAAEHIELVSWFVPKIDNWSVCDSFCGGLKFTREAKEEVWEFLQPYFASEAPFDIRFAFVMALDYYIEESYLPKLFVWADQVSCENYYVKMAVAWALSMCYVKFPKETEHYLDACKLDVFTYKKTIQKICESLRVDAEQKQQLRKKSGKFM